MACQMLSQFMNIESVFLEVKRVLAPGGVFLFTEEPLRRLPSLRVYRAPYRERMKSWERKLFDWGLLGYLARDVIGAEQEESFGIRQNHSMYLADWHRLVARHFAAHSYSLRARARLGRAHREARRRAMNGAPRACLAARWRRFAGRRGVPGRCPVSGASRPPALPGLPRRSGPRCAPMRWRARAAIAPRTRAASTTCCPPRLRAELYPGDRGDVIDFSLPGHAARLGEGWYELEGDFGNKYRWIGAGATAVLRRERSVPQRLRLRGYAHEIQFTKGQPVVEIRVNGLRVCQQALERVGLFIIEADLPEAETYHIEIAGAPAWTVPDDDRIFTVNISMIRLVDAES